MFHATATLYHLNLTDTVNLHYNKWRPFIKEVIGVILDEANADPFKLTIRLTLPDDEFDLKPWEVYGELMLQTYVPVQQGHTISVIVGYKQEDNSITPSLKLAYYFEA